MDLFDPRHARKVLVAFGRAYGALPENVGDLGSDQESFLDQSISGLAEEGKIISVRLALFAEMVKGKPWTPATLKEVGGTEGVGLTFLEETFSASDRPSRASPSPESRPGGAESSASRERHRHQGADEIAPGIARSIGLCEPPQGLRRPDPHPRP